MSFTMLLTCSVDTPLRSEFTVAASAKKCLATVDDRTFSVAGIVCGAMSPTVKLLKLSTDI